jgi:chromosome segregation ATPase
MTLEEQVNYYKTMFQKSRTLSKFFDGETKRLKEKLSNYECQDGEECELIMKFKYDKDIFYLFKDSKKKFFINEITLDKELIEQLKNNPSIKLYDFEKDLKNKDNYLTQIINQYEEKLKNLIKENESVESKLKELQNNHSQLNQETSKGKIILENNIKLMLEKSNEINIQLKNIFDMDNITNDDNIIKEIYEKIKENINNLKTIYEQNNLNPNNNNDINIWLNELNNFIILLLNELQDNIFKILEKEKEEYQEKNKYQKTIDEIMINHQNEKNALFMELEGNRNKLNNLNNKIIELEKEKHKISKEKENSIKILNKQINSGVNLNYLKNIMISFLSSNDKNIQDRLLPVIYKSLDFNQSEIKTVQENRNKSNGILSYFRNN